MPAQKKLTLYRAAMFFHSAGTVVWLKKYIILSLNLFQVSSLILTGLTGSYDFHIPFQLMALSQKPVISILSQTRISRIYTDAALNPC